MNPEQQALTTITNLMTAAAGKPERFCIKCGRSFSVLQPHLNLGILCPDCKASVLSNQPVAGSLQQQQQNTKTP
jgi:predicted amidophosphoribosyltransferase